MPAAIIDRSHDCLFSVAVAPIPAVPYPFRFVATCKSMSPFQEQYMFRQLADLLFR